MSVLEGNDRFRRSRLMAGSLLVRVGLMFGMAVLMRWGRADLTILTGFGLPDDALHSPNEKMDLEQYHRGTEMVLHLMENLGAGEG